MRSVEEGCQAGEEVECCEEAGFGDEGRRVNGRGEEFGVSYDWGLGGLRE